MVQLSQMHRKGMPRRKLVDTAGLALEPVLIVEEPKANPPRGNKPKVAPYRSGNLVASRGRPKIANIEQVAKMLDRDFPEIVDEIQAQHAASEKHLLPHEMFIPIGSDQRLVALEDYQEFRRVIDGLLLESRGSFVTGFQTANKVRLKTRHHRHIDNLTYNGRLRLLPPGLGEVVHHAEKMDGVSLSAVPVPFRWDIFDGDEAGSLAAYELQYNRANKRQKVVKSAAVCRTPNFESFSDNVKMLMPLWRNKSDRDVRRRSSWGVRVRKRVSFEFIYIFA